MMTIEKPGKENNNSKNHRDFGRHDIYLPKSINNKNSNYYNEENRFKFKNSLIITPYYEVEFNGTGGIKYLTNHDGCEFFAGDNIFFRTNNIQKMPVLLKREINKLSSQKKLIVEEKYNYEEKYEVHQNIVLYYEENRIDFQMLIYIYRFILSHYPRIF